ncbi:hypothetical protein EV714DRAFT_271995 [Schizophyllum commune]
MARVARVVNRIYAAPDDSSSSSRDSSLSRPRPASSDNVDEWVFAADPNDNDHYQALSLDDVYGYEFKPGQQVWVRDADGLWHLARTTSKAPKVAPARFKDGLYYTAVWLDHDRARKPCTYAPQNGDIKPDTPHIRRLLLEEGHIVLED